MTVAYGLRAAALLACALVFAASPASAAPDRMTGQWEVSLGDTGRKCTMMLRDEAAGGGERRLSMPAGCRRALPILGNVNAWTMTAARELALESANGTPVLTFAQDREQRFVAKGPEGEVYALVALDGAGAQADAPAGGGIRVLPPAAASAARPGGTERVAATKPAPAVVAKPGPDPDAALFRGRTGDLAGRYIILREGAKDVGCMLTFDERGRGPRGSFKAQLAPACRDQGIVVFDPTGWQLERGKLALTARKGHTALFNWHADGTWWKDPQDGGKPLGLKKMDY